MGRQEARAHYGDCPGLSDTWRPGAGRRNHRQDPATASANEATTLAETESHLRRTAVRLDEFVKGHTRSGALPSEAFTEMNQRELHEVLLDSSRPDLEPEPRGKAIAFHGPEVAQG